MFKFFIYGYKASTQESRYYWGWVTLLAAIPIVNAEEQRRLY